VAYFENEDGDFLVLCVSKLQKNGDALPRIDFEYASEDLE